jgi:Chalcone isomerase-like
MHKTLVLLGVALCMPISTISVNAAGLAGVTLPETSTVGDKSLVLNGVGLRSEFMVKVYVAGLYLPQKSSDAGAIIKVDEPKRLVMQFLHNASKKQMTDAFDESFRVNTPDAEKTMKSDIDSFLAALEDVTVGEQMVFTYVSGTGTTLAIGGKNKLTIVGAPFSELIFSVWLGPQPPTASLKKGILGQ